MSRPLGAFWAMTTILMSCDSAILGGGVGDAVCREECWVGLVCGMSIFHCPLVALYHGE